MSDLLTRLVARATGKAKSPVEPILASRYEPTTQIPGFAAPFETTAAFPAATSRRIERARPSRIAPDEILNLEPVRGRALEIEAHKQREGPDGQRKGFLDEREVSQTPPTLIASALTPGRRPEIETRGPEDGNAELVESTVISGNTEMHPARDPRALAQSIESELEFIRRERIVVAAASGNDPSAHRGLGTERSITSPTSPAEVNVTIGTIEVRLSPPPQAPTRRAAPPKVSLDDYLARRSGSRR